MDREEVKEKVRKIAFEAYNPIYNIELNDNESLRRWGLDLFDMVYFIIGLEKEFQITISDDEFDYSDESITVNNLADKIINKLQEQIKE